MATDPVRLDRGRGPGQSFLATATDRARAGCSGLGQRWLPAVHSADLESFLEAVSSRGGRSGPQPAASGSCAGHTSPAAVHGLRGHGCALCFRDRCAVERQVGCTLGPLDPAVDDRGLDVSDRGHCSGQLVGLLRIGLGRLVVLGPGGERIVHALVGRHRADSYAGGH